MRKIWLILIIFVSIVGAITGFLIYQHVPQENDDWINRGSQNDEKDSISNDVASDDNAAEAIQYLLQREIMEVKEDGNFYPKEEVTVRESLQVISKCIFPRWNEKKMSEEEWIAFLKEKKIIEEDFAMEKLNCLATNYEIAIVLAKTDVLMNRNEQMMGKGIVIQEEIDDVTKTWLQHVAMRGFIPKQEPIMWERQRALHREELAEIIYLFLTN